MADQYSGDMIVGLDEVVAKTVQPYGFSQPAGVFSTDLFQHFTISMWLPLVLIAEASRFATGNSKATAIHIEE